MNHPDHLLPLPVIHEKIETSYMHHRGVWCIALSFAYNKGLVERVKSIPGRRNSKTNKCWYLPADESSLKALITFAERQTIKQTIEQTQAEDTDIDDHVLHVLPDTLDSIDHYDIDHAIREDEQPTPSSHTTVDKVPLSLSCDTTDETPSKGDNDAISCAVQEPSVLPPTQLGSEEATDIGHQNDDRPRLEITLQDNRLIMDMTYDVADVTVVKGLSGAWWDKKAKKWIVRATPANVVRIQGHFNYWTKEAYDKIVDLVSLAVSPMIVELYHTPQYRKMIAVKISGYKADYSLLKSMSDRHYDKAYRRWIVPDTPAHRARIIEHYTSQGAKIVDRLPSGHLHERQDPSVKSLSEKKRYLISKFSVTDQEILHPYIDAMIRMRYSWRTVTQYTGAFAKWITAISPHTPEDATTDMVNAYLATLSGQKISESLLHRAVSAIKFYYVKVVFRPDIEVEQIQRPKKRKSLPTILSIGEVDRMLRTTTNLKHTCILYALYSSGLRLGELLNLKVDHILWDRNQVIVKDGKGKKDRMVMLSQRLKALLERYFDQYKPVRYLYEGQGGKGPYSSKSVQSIVKRAAKAAGIQRPVTPHTLRHCFATHLLDNGTDVRYIQELLGHKDIKTTLIYTHVTTHTLNNITSPLDRLGNQEDDKKAKL